MAPKNDDVSSNRAAVNEILQVLEGLDDEGRMRVLAVVGAYFGVTPRAGLTAMPGASPKPAPNFSESSKQSPSAKQFLLEKQPKTDVERIACLAFYLTHYADQPHFKTLDLTKLNTDAAQPKFTNAAKAAGNAVEYGYLAPATKGNRQLSAAGEVFVQYLPDRESAKAAMKSTRPRKLKGGGRKRASGRKDS